MNIELAGLRRLLGARDAEPDWDAVYAEQLPRVFNFFRYRVGDGAVAEDLTATTFEKAWRARARYRSDVAAFSTWLFSIARNVAADHFRRRHDEAPLDEAMVDARERGPEAIVEQRDAFARLSALLAALPARERDVLALKYGADLTNRAIAEVTDLSESNVGTLAARAVQKLREAWDQHAG